MRILFSEHQSDYSRYIYDYAIWAVPEGDETPADVMDKGFLPAALRLDRFYLCRNIRVDLSSFAPNSENRRIKRKGEGITCRLVKKADFEFTQERLDFCHHYAKVKWGEGVMDFDRLNRVIESEVISHLLVFSEGEKEIGFVMMYLESGRLAYYYYSFYDLDHPYRSLGMYMMLSAIEHFKEESMEYIYLGTCYSRTATYKTQFAGVQFFNGFKWSENIKELKYLVDRQGETRPTQHLLATKEYGDEFYPGDFDAQLATDGFKVIE